MKTRGEARAIIIAGPILLLLFCAAVAVMIVTLNPTWWSLDLSQSNYTVDALRPFEAPTPTADVEAPPPNPPTLKVAAWNLHVYGPTTAADDTLLASYVDVIDDYDVIVLQEIRDKEGKAREKLVALLPGYGSIYSSPYKDEEVYLILWRKGVVYKRTFTDWSPHNWRDVFEHPPTTIGFESAHGRWAFNLTVLHAKPTEARAELAQLEELVRERVTGEQLVVGDLNADCSYYPTPPLDFQGWRWVIPDDADTTVNPNTDCAYDRIILNHEAEDNLLDWGVMTNVTPEQSDHYLVWAEFNADPYLP